MINHDIKFLTSDDSVIVKNDDFKTFKYESKKKSEESVYDQAKRSYCERRGGKWRVTKPRLMRELESKLRERSVVLCEWLSETIVVIVFSSGSIAYLTVNPDTLDLTQILFDRYCIGKLSGQSVTGVVFSSTHILFTHTDCSATLISFGKVVPPGVLSRISDRNPHVQTIELADGARRAERKVSWSAPSAASAPASVAAPSVAAPGPRVLVWTAAGAEPAPWSPAAEVRANLHLYQLHGQHMHVVAFHQLEGETLLAEVSRAHCNIVHIVEQTTSHKNGVTLDWLRFDVPPLEEGVIRLSTHRAGETRASLPAVARAATRSPCGRRLVASCIDGTLCLVQQGAGLTHSVKAGFVSILVVIVFE
ncbi:hypothetical protein JYU34_009036 [Plutella xylostella]|uniref:Uncharacterized protein n=1 Tax=Plutella xylostella TaxID=51655 RepID=A0ABQ7QMF3_PLUXY|nr:hypothetical protein JYU34_009036 [Plutella xylostella]